MPGFYVIFLRKILFPQIFGANAPSLFSYAYAITQTIGSMC